MNLAPLADRVVVKATQETETASGIILPGSGDEKPKQGEVVAVGPGKDDKGINIQIGEQVIFNQYSPTEVEVDGEKYLIISESDVLAVVTKD